jgi:hypothetical protein
MFRDGAEVLSAMDGLHGRGRDILPWFLQTFALKLAYSEADDARLVPAGNATEI